MNARRTGSPLKHPCRRWMAVSLVSLLLIAATAVFAMAVQTRPSLTLLASEQPTPAPYQPELEIELAAHSAIAVETGRMRRLYAKNADILMNIPSASKIMTALIACERLSLNTPITISKVAAEAGAKETTGDDVILHNGDKYPLQYLLLRLIFYDSDAAALAIAEQISGIEETFVELMNAKAASFELKDTIFRNSTGQPIVIPSDDQKSEADPKPTGVPGAEPIPLQYTTVSDLARLVSQAMLDDDFAKIIRTDSEYLVLDGEVLVAMRNAVQSIWTLSENQVTGAFYCENQSQSYLITIGKVNDISLVMITAAGSISGRLTDTLNLIDALGDTYIQTRLVDAGEAFQVEQERTIDGEVFGLIFKRNVLYVHPRNDLFLVSPIQYNSFGPHRRPIELGMTVGQVVFTLKDGTIIAVDVGPDRQILSSITLVNQALNILQNNDNLLFVLMISCALLLFGLCVHVARRMVRLIRLQILLRLEKRSRR